ncbi:HAD-IIIC family phosphatase [Stigmatella erecta]|uniref:HAD-superfamily phosphatase, subfamily IIIC/FkbH-like domain-containing protein n=1 Tax=Stigmatella erecta TaxID=83460 RepID=A0A1H9YSZ8_9BACT|nr:HAD-IIIC family phosphatase [Stigmatella erecta]SES71665.1 HAD-superfamily phosphatase, subfamily IIIC/FkbH-like domain-containing protein [Stigmatella erecta]
MDANTLKSVKLVIWDLDDTFWGGTLSEGGVQYRQEMHDAVLTLAEHGIISSIASNNDHETIRQALTGHGLWEHFVFPAIHWGTKPEMVRAILENVQLRPQNTVFLDDKLRIREAVSKDIPALLAVDTAEAFLTAFQAWSVGREPSDPELERLKHYKVLESKGQARSAFTASGSGTARDFLVASEVVCTVSAVDGHLFDRVLELIARTNQLNYTLKRSTAEELRQMLTQPAFECGVVHVRDRFGDYGVCGFYALERTQAPRLRHFLFSCRVLQMGVEETLYRWLGSPEVDAAPERVGELAQLMARVPQTDWVKLADARGGTSVEPSPVSSAQPRQPAASEVNMLLVGPCELEIIGGGLQSFGRGVAEPSMLVNFRADDGRIIRHFGHASWFELAAQPEVADRWAEDLRMLPWFHPSLVDGRLKDGGGNQVMVLSSVRTAQSALYRHVSGEFSVPFDYFGSWLGGLDLTKPDDWQRAEFYSMMMHAASLPEPLLERFAARYTFEGPIRASQYEQALLRLCQRLPEGCRLAVITVPDMAQARSPLASAPEAAVFAQWQRQHQAVNEAIANASRAAPAKLAVLDVNKYVSEASGLTGPSSPPEGDAGPEPFFEWVFRRYYHYERHVYVNLAMDLLRQLQAWQLLSIDEAQLQHLSGMAFQASAPPVPSLP